MKTYTAQHLYYIVSCALYASLIVIFSLILITTVSTFDVRAWAGPSIASLFLASLGIGYKFASTGNTTVLRIAGTISIAILLTFAGFFIVAGVGWLVALSEAR